MSTDRTENQMTELQQARADYIAALQRNVKLDQQVSDLGQQVFELTMKLTAMEFRAMSAEMMLKAVCQGLLTRADGGEPGRSWQGVIRVGCCRLPLTTRCEALCTSTSERDG